jgi:hypothetical protein
VLVVLGDVHTLPATFAGLRAAGVVRIGTGAIGADRISGAPAVGVARFADGGFVAAPAQRSERQDDGERRGEAQIE